jgi:hypothetical protein
MLGILTLCVLVTITVAVLISQRAPSTPIPEDRDWD